MSYSESPRQETSPAAAEFEFNPAGVAFIVQNAVGKLVETKQTGFLPTKPDGITFDQAQAARNIRLEAQVRTMASTLNSIVQRTDGRPWEEVIEDFAAESIEAASDGSAEQGQIPVDS